jgi:hypothetical protein
MWKLIAVVTLSSLSLVLTALPAYALCTNDQVQTCTDQSNGCSSLCNFAGAPQSCYDRCVCGYYECRASCGDGDVPQFCHIS